MGARPIPAARPPYKTGPVKLTELVVTLVLTTGLAGAMSKAIDVPARVASATAVAERVDCRMVESAIVAYGADHDAPPAQIADIQPYLRGDISGYRLTAGTPVGPGCEDQPAGFAG